MVDNRWIKICVIPTLLPLLLLLLPQVSAADKSRLVENGSNITLSCKNLIDQNECNATTWTFSPGRVTRGRPSIELIKLGQITEHAGNKSHRLHVLKNCSLGIKNVAAEDAGVYCCLQYLSDQKPAEQAQSPTELSVVTMTEEMSNNKAKLNCSVATYERCRLKVELLFSGTTERRIPQTGKYLCHHSLEVMSYENKYKERYKSLKCTVKENSDEVVQEFAFRPRPSARNTKTTTQSTTTTTTTELTAAPHNAPTNLKDWWWLFVVVAVILAALFITCVTVWLYKRKKGNQTHTTECANNEDGVFYSSISFTRVGKARVLGKNDESESDAVTYSTVKSSSVDPSHVYASVNSPS